MKSNCQYIFIVACAVLAALTDPASAERGDLDLSFNPSVNDRISSLAVQADGKILVTGIFTEAGGMARSHLARLHADGTLDQGFNPNFNLGTSVPVSSMAIQTDGKILIGGQFTMVNEVMRTSSIARLNADGTLDLSFNPAVDGFPFLYIGSIVIQPDGKILIGGDFTRVNGVARNSFARLNADGTVDLDFRPLVGTSSEQARVYDTALQPDGKILIYGRLFKIDGTYRHYLVRLNSDGTLDPGFNVDTDYEVEVLALQTDGKILIGSDFSTVGGVRRPGLARINADGTLDLGFNPLGDYEQTYIIAPQRDGKILLGGEYNKEDRIGGSLIDGGLVQLNADGALDRDFNASVNVDGDGWSRGVWDIAIQADGKILVAGYFNSVNGISRTNLARLLGQPANEVSVCCVSLVDGLPGFDITSSNARTVVVEGSTNLVNWSGIQTIPVGNVPVRFSDQDHADFLSRFYRVSWQP